MYMIVPCRLRRTFRSVGALQGERRMASSFIGSRRCHADDAGAELLILSFHWQLTESILQQS